MVNHPDISVCGELANASKHGVDKKYHVGAMTFSVPDGSMKRITFLDRQVEADVQNSETVEYRLPVLDSSENDVGNAFEYAARAIAALEHFRLKIEEP